MACACERSNETPRNIKYGEFVDYLDVLVSQEISCCMQLVTYNNASSNERKTRALNSRRMEASYAIYLPWLFSETLWPGAH